MELRVDPIQRYAKTRAHTATHLLHAELAAIFPQTKQAGSLVDEDYLRFDFYSDTLLSDNQVETVQSKINSIIAQALPVSTQEVWYDDAIKAWAKAFFEDKYGDTVRVVTVWDKLSVELCGGTHVSNTKDIGAFTIISQEAVASGIKRITAVTWPKVAEELQTRKKELQTIAQLLWVQEKQIQDKIVKTTTEYEELKKEYEKMSASVLVDYIKNMVATWKQYEWYVVISVDKDKSFKDVVHHTKQLPWYDDMLLYNEDWSFAIISWLGKAKSFAQAHNLKWGWSDQLFQGKDPAILALLS